MVKPFRLAPALTLALVLAAAPAPAFNGGDSPRSARQELRQRLTLLLERHQQLEHTLQSSRQELERLARRRQEALDRARELEAQAPRLAQRLEAVELQLRGLARLVQEQEAGFHQRLRALYLYGPDVSAALWATSQDFADALQRTQALDRLLAADRRRLDALNQRRSELAALKAELAYRKNELAEVKAQQAALAERLSRMQTERRALLAGLQEQEKRLEVSIAALSEAEARLARTFALPGAAPASKERPPAAGPGVMAARGALSPPVEGRLVGRGGPGRRGVVLAARPGAPVRAPWAGTVVYAAPLAGYGRVVVLDHGQRVHTVLAHLGALSVEKGMQCYPGQVVGAVDGTGRLYLEVRRAARPVNPLTWLRLKP